MEAYQWVINREQELESRAENLEQELRTVDSELTDIETVKAYFQNHVLPTYYQNIFTRYMININAYCNWNKVIVDDIESDPDERFMRDIETKIGISENAKKAFREEILIRESAMTRKGEVFDYQTNERLKKAIEKMI